MPPKSLHYILSRSYRTGQQKGMDQVLLEKVYRKVYHCTYINFFGVPINLPKGQVPLYCHKC